MGTEDKSRISIISNSKEKRMIYLIQLFSLKDGDIMYVKSENTNEIFLIPLKEYSYVWNGKVNW